MKIYVVSSEWDGPQAAFRTREAAVNYTRTVSGGALMSIRELTLEN